MPRVSTSRTGSTDYVAPPFTGGTPPFNINTAPRTGQGPFGLVPGGIGLPPVYNDVAGVFPNLSGNLGALSSNIASELAGELDPQTIAMLQNTSAQFGIGSGSPLSPFSGASGLRHLGQTVEAQKAKGNADLLAALPTVAKTLTVSPETQLEVANRNATLNAAPDPQAAAREAQRLFDLYLARLGGGRGGGSLSYSPGASAPRNLNAGQSFSPWGTSPVNSFQGTLQQNPYQGILGGTQRAPQDMWSPYAGGFPGPEGGSVATPGGGGFNDWFNDPFLGGGGGMFGLGGGAQGAGNDVAGLGDWFNWDTNPTLPDFPEWQD
jgi:hypothetical protein